MAVLGVAGERRLHLHDFNAFLVLVLGVAVALVVVFMATRCDGGADPAARGTPE